MSKRNKRRVIAVDVTPNQSTEAPVAEETQAGTNGEETTAGQDNSIAGETSIASGDVGSLLKEVLGQQTEAAPENDYVPPAAMGGADTQTGGDNGDADYVPPAASDTGENEQAGDDAVEEARELEDFELFAKQVMHYTGNDRKQAWEIFCYNFAGMLQHTAKEPDMSLLNNDQRAALRGMISR